MALRHIITLPDPKLRLISKPLERVDDSVRKLLDDMVETMHEAPGVGLAAIQIAEALRLVVVGDSTGAGLGVTDPRLREEIGETTLTRFRRPGAHALT